MCFWNSVQMCSNEGHSIVFFTASVCIGYFISFCNLLVLYTSVNCYCFWTALITYLTDNIMICLFFVCLIECRILSAITRLWAFLITVSLSAGNALLPDIAIKKLNKKNKSELFQICPETALSHFINFLNCKIKCKRQVQRHYNSWIWQHGGWARTFAQPHARPIRPCLMFLIAMLRISACLYT